MDVHEGCFVTSSCVCKALCFVYKGVGFSAFAGGGGFSVEGEEEEAGLLVPVLKEVVEGIEAQLATVIAGLVQGVERTGVSVTEGGFKEGAQGVVKLLKAIFLTRLDGVAKAQGMCGNVLVQVARNVCCILSHEVRAWLWDLCSELVLACSVGRRSSRQGQDQPQARHANQQRQHGKRERESVCVCVCERERECVCVCGCVDVHEDAKCCWMRLVGDVSAALADFLMAPMQHFGNWSVARLSFAITHQEHKQAKQPK